MNPASIKPPPLLLGLSLVFWGWHSEFLSVGVCLGVAVELSRVFRGRWEFSNEDFQRVWTFCTLVLLSSLVYAFTANDGPSDFRGFFQNPNFNTQREAGTASARTAASVIRWLPMIFFPFVAVQVYSSREGIPLETISLILRRRWRQARKEGRPAPPQRFINVSYLYFVLVVFASCVHNNDQPWFFWSLAAMLAWALWPLRSRRYALPIWGLAFVLAAGLGYAGKLGVSQFTRYLEGLNYQFLMRWTRGRFDHSQSRTELGSLGRLKSSGAIVVRLQTTPGSNPPLLLREASYRSLKGLTWVSDIPRTAFENILSETNQTSWTLVPGKTNFQSAEIACYLPRGIGLLPLPTGSGRLENLQAYLLQRSPMGAILAEGPGLVIFDALYGPGQTVDGPPNPAEDLRVPGHENRGLVQAAAEIELGPERDLETVRDAVSRFFASRFSYSTWQERDRFGRGERTPLERFLTETRSGHCEYFATATVLLLRQFGIPARYAVGYVVHEENGPNRYVIRERDAHAWCLAWNEQLGIWEDLDTTPGSWLAGESNKLSRFQPLSDFWNRLKFEFSKVRWGQTRLREYILIALIPVLLLLLYKILFRRRRHKSALDGGAIRRRDWPGLDSEFYQLERMLTRKGVLRNPGETLSLWLQRAISDPALAAVQEPLRRVLWLHYRYRFDPEGLLPREREELRSQARACLQALTKS